MYWRVDSRVHSLAVSICTRAGGPQSHRPQNDCCASMSSERGDTLLTSLAHSHARECIKSAQIKLASTNYPEVYPRQAYISCLNKIDTIRQINVTFIDCCRKGRREAYCVQCTLALYKSLSCEAARGSVVSDHYFATMWAWGGSKANVLWQPNSVPVISHTYKAVIPFWNI